MFKKKRPEIPPTPAPSDELEELLARVREILRRAHEAVDAVIGNEAQP